MKTLIIFIILSLPFYILGFFSAPTNVPEILIAVSFVCYLVKKIITLKKTKIEKPQKRNLLIIGLLFLAVGIFISTTQGDNIIRTAGIIKSWFLIPPMFYLVVADYLRDKEDKERKYLLVVFALSGIFVALYSLISLSFSYDFRLIGFFGNSNYLSMYLAPSFLAAFYLFFSEDNKKNKYSWLIALAVILMPLILTFSYGAWIALVIAVLFLGKRLTNHKNFVILVLLISGMSLLLVFGNTQKFRNLSGERSSLVARFEIWRASAEIIKDNKALGIGLGGFQAEYLRQQSKFQPYLNWAVLHPHNTFLQFLVETGVVGFIGFVMVVVYFIKKSTYQIKKNPAAMGANLFVFSFLIYFLIHGLADTMYFKNDLSVMFWFFMALL